MTGVVSRPSCAKGESNDRAVDRAAVAAASHARQELAVGGRGLLLCAMSETLSAVGSAFAFHATREWCDFAQRRAGQDARGPDRCARVWTRPFGRGGYWWGGVAGERARRGGCWATAAFRVGLRH
jgi:hypothetical protein